VTAAYGNRSLIVSPKPASRYGLAQVWLPVPYTAPLHLAESERLKLRIFLDRSIVEVFANDQVAVTAHCYPDPDSTGIRLFARGGQAQLRSLDVWQMNPIWPGTF
jgi:beta-fructofuranosidase